MTLINALATVLLTWQAPTTCADNVSPLTECPTANYEVHEAQSLTGTYTLKASPAAAVTSVTVTTTPGNRCYLMRTVTIDQQKSADSTKVCTSVPSLPPKAPQGLTVEVKITVQVQP